MKARLATFILALVFSLSVGATTIPIVSYDISDAMVSGYGIWQHTYSGVITPTGQTVAGIAVANYTGGSGTLNDSVVGTDSYTTQLFFTGTTTGGDGSVSPVITLYLGGTYIINSISLLGGNIVSNAVPGCITGVTVGLGSASAAISTTGYGMSGFFCGGVNDLATITGTSLDGVPTSSIVLSGFTLSALSSGSFSITEIQIDGTPVGSEAPEPASAAMMGGGLAALALLLRRRKG
ncbi:MAG: PEP-CTERM sorting domain-containing protein [Bryobacteraceae bacterium]